MVNMIRGREIEVSWVWKLLEFIRVRVGKFILDFVFLWSVLVDKLVSLVFGFLYGLVKVRV